jgi:type IV fimbrial biogenesis protein FimT
MNTTPMHRRSLGLTLIELLMVLVIIAVTLTLGAPQLDRLIQKNRIESISRDLLGSINLARSEAIMRRASVSICPSAMWQTGEATCTGSYQDGWIVFSNVNRDDQVDVATDDVIRVYAALPEGYAVANRLATRAVTKRITYRADGSSYRNLTLQVCSPDGRIPSMSIVLNIVGRARLDRNWGQCQPVA